MGAILGFVALAIGTLPSKAHKEPIHERIATNAVLSSAGMTVFVKETLGGSTNLLSFEPWEFRLKSPQLPSFWVGRGAYNQDYWPRWGNHFYTVKPGRTVGQANGLSDGSERWKDVVPLPLPKPVTNSFAWATDPSVDTPKTILWSRDPFKLFFFASPPPKTNDNTWAIARECQLIGLTNSSRTTRDENLAHMFYALGHIIHLNQDTSQPDHTRDDAHPNRPFIENYGLGKYNAQPGTFNPVPRGWAYWRDQAHFTRLLDFWDRGFYQGDAAALDADNSGNPAAKLGLAEFSNGNLLGENALYAEFFESKSNKTHYFPHPSLKDTDQPRVRPFLNSITLVDGTVGNSPYLQKTSAGTNVAHHSALRYFAVMNMSRMSTLPARTAVTIKNDNVLSNYHDIMIPKAIEYSGGILDYFFRGTMAVSVSDYDTNDMIYTCVLENTSGESFHGGEFLIFEDDAEGNRTLLTNTPLAGVLANNQSFTMTFPGDGPLTNTTLAVYRGTIGIGAGNIALDPVDAGLAIAVRRINSWVEFNTNTNFSDYLENFGLEAGDTLVGVLESPEFAFDLSTAEYEVRINTAFFDDRGTIGSLESTGPSTSCGYDNEITNQIVPPEDIEISPDGKHLRINITATDNPGCGIAIGWWGLSVTWRAKPNTVPD